MQDFIDGHFDRAVVANDYNATGGRCFAMGESIQCFFNLRRAGPLRENELYFDLFSREVVDSTHRHFFLFDRILNGGCELFGGLPERKLRDHQTTFPLFNFGTNFDFSDTVVVFGDIHNAAKLEVGQRVGLVRCTLVLAKNFDLLLKKLNEVVGQDGGGEANSDSIGTKHQ